LPFQRSGKRRRSRQRLGERQCRFDYGGGGRSVGARPDPTERTARAQQHPPQRH